MEIVDIGEMRQRVLEHILKERKGSLAAVAGARDH